MPELPEVETVRRGLAPILEGARIEKVEVRRPDLRIPFPPKFRERLTGRRVEALKRRAKFLVAELDDGTALIIHLGMSGSFRFSKEAVGGDAFHHPRSRLEVHDHVVFHLSNGTRLVFNDPRRFGLMDLVPIAELSESKHFKKLGMEPDAKSLDGPALAALMGKRKVAIKVALCDQHLVAGLGNIYASESLWRAEISPRRKASSLGTRGGATRGGAERAARLAKAIHEVLADAIKAGGSSLRDHARVDGELGEFQHSFAVYDREGEPCLRRDNGTIKRIVQGGRSTFFCPKCQK